MFKVNNQIELNEDDICNNCKYSNNNKCSLQLFMLNSCHELTGDYIITVDSCVHHTPNYIDMEFFDVNDSDSEV